MALYFVWVIGYTFQTSCTRSGQTVLTNDPNQRPLFTIFNTVGSLLGMGAMQFFAPILAKNYAGGYSSAAFFRTLFSLVDKLVSSLSATVVGVAVGIIGLDILPTQYSPYTPGMNVMVIVLFCVIPMIAWAATLIAMKGYTLTGEKMKEIQAVNACRKQAIAEGMSMEQAMQQWQTMEDVRAH